MEHFFQQGKEILSIVRQGLPKDAKFVRFMIEPDKTDEIVVEFSTQSVEGIKDFGIVFENFGMKRVQAVPAINLN